MLTASREGGKSVRRIVGIGIATLFAVACGGGAAPATSATQAASAAPAATTAATVAPSPSPAAQSGPKLSDLVKSGKLTSYKVSYKWSTGQAGQEGQQTWYYKPPKARYDYAIAGAGTFSVFKLEDGAYFCTIVPGAGGFCQKLPGEAGLQQNAAADFDLQVSGKPDQFSAIAAGTKTIAGQQAQCFTVKALAGAGFGDATSCYSSTGVPLFMQMGAQGQSVTMEATTFSTTVSDDDFKLPGPVR
jgi:hypothetical protein